jgi:hypothetical protein
MLLSIEKETNKIHEEHPVANWKCWKKEYNQSKGDVHEQAK